MLLSFRPIACLLLLAALPTWGRPRLDPPTAGERIYRDGLLPSGAFLEGVVKGDIPVSGQAMTCAHCHMRGGLGSTEGGVVTPPIHGPRLFQPAYRVFPRLATAEREQRGLKGESLRPAYTEPTLAHALRTGLDPTGREFHDIMPRYDLKDRDMAILVRYLKSLSATVSPGVDETTLRFATIIGADVSPADREAMLKPLQAYITFHNQLSRGFGHRMYRSPVGRELIQDHRAFSLVPWILTGPRSTWKRQLAARYRREPVFAFLGGITTGSWQPIHEFCEAHRIPCLLPITEFPVISDRDWYTLYFSRGHRQEGETAARFLANGPVAAAASRVLQLVQGEAGRALAAGFQEAWRGLGRPAPRTVQVADDQPLDAAYLQTLLREEQPSALLLWTRPGSLEALRDAIGSVPAAIPWVVSAGYWKEAVFHLPEALRSHAYITYPYRHPADEAKARGNTVTSLVGEAGRRDEARIASRMYSLVQVLNKGFMELDGGYYRDHLLDRISMLPDQSLPDFERLGFGPGQRYASKGCYVMQLTLGSTPQLVKRSDWVSH